MSSASASQLVWLITDTSSGFGRELALAALNRGDKVIATARARSLSSLDGLKAKGAEAIELDVTASLDVLKGAAAKAVGIYGKVDILVNNAGYVLNGAMEENTPEETQNQFNTNVFGPLNVARAFLPYMRERKSGTVIFIGSMAGWIAISNTGIYAASVSISLDDEITPLGLRSICIEPGYFRTSLLSGDNRNATVPRIPDYQAMVEQADAALSAYHGKQAGDPVKAAEVIVDLGHGVGSFKGKKLPKVLVLGKDCYDAVKNESEKTLENLEEWKEVSQSTDL
ncbi:hypothetical protein NP233_g5687 [Leucocoprinus birnbaumii]|uniref:Uncharacterized protein n=1 Tax=Leucocoprinus birnbaumii TaxID=56174 RepID=A0AAD5VSE3_9AGAR|nr:hypothetical protein NP233_g5687 [Leucocoprinus birnbaumii]